MIAARCEVDMSNARGHLPRGDDRSPLPNLQYGGTSVAISQVSTRISHFWFFVDELFDCNWNQISRSLGLRLIQAGIDGQCA